MRIHLNTLYVTTEGAWVHKDGQNVVVSADKKDIGRVPIHMIGSIVCFGRVMVSPPLMGLCSEQGVSIVFLSEYGRFIARVEGPVSGNVLLRREQYRRSDDPMTAAQVASSVVAGKVYNQRSVLRRVLRDHGKSLDAGKRDDIRSAEQQLSRIIERIGAEQSVDYLRGLEGAAGSLYFGIFYLLLRGESALEFRGRSRRPPLDPVNAVLSFVYTLLVHDCRSALESVGLDPAVGFLHRDRPGRPSLALDLMEEFRAPFADRLALSLFNRRQLNRGAFQFFDNGAVLLNEQGRKIVLSAWQARKQNELLHAYTEKTVSAGMLWHIQAMLLARHLRGDLDAYPPYLNR